MINDEQLILTVQKYPCIYNTSNTKYMDNKYKAEIWKKIGEELNQTNIVMCRNRWQNIRDQFRKYLMKRSAKSPEEAEKMRKYKYEELLQFLIPLYGENLQVKTNCESPSNFCVAIKTEEFNITDGADEDGYSSGKPNSPINPQQFIKSISEESVQSSEINDTQGEYDLQSVKKKRKHGENESVTLLDYLLDKIKKEKSTDQHPIDAFLNGIAATIKNFSPYYQHLAKSKIFEVVQQLELLQLQNASDDCSLNLSNN